MKKNFKPFSKSSDQNKLAIQIEFLISWKIKTMPDKKTLVLHPFILAVYPILFYYTLNKHEVWFFETLVPMASSLFVALLLFFLFKFTFKSTTKSGILTSFVLILFFIYEAIQTKIADSDSVKYFLDSIKKLIFLLSKNCSCKTSPYL